MSEELIRKDDALRLIAAAKKPAGRAYQGERLKGVLSGLRIAEDLVRSLKAAEQEDAGERSFDSAALREAMTKRRACRQRSFDSAALREAMTGRKA